MSKILEFAARFETFARTLPEPYRAELLSLVYEHMYWSWDYCGKLWRRVR